MTGSLDHWAEWLLHRRHGGDPDAVRRTLEYLAAVRDRVLDNARIAPGETVLDVGCGDGLIGFGTVAIWRRPRVEQGLGISWSAVACVRG